MLYHKPIPVFEDHERFLKLIEISPEKECWIFSGRISRGYGIFYTLDTTKGKIQPYMAHRISWSIFKGTPTPGLVIDHICMNKTCINPDHLREVTSRINTLENSTSIASLNKLKTHCKKGHLFDTTNTSFRSGGRYVNTRSCKTCNNSIHKAWRDRKK